MSKKKIKRDNKKDIKKDSKKIINDIEEIEEKEINNARYNDNTDEDIDYSDKKSGLPILDIIIIVLIIILMIIGVSIYFLIKKSSGEETNRFETGIDNIFGRFQEDVAEESEEPAEPVVTENKDNDEKIIIHDEEYMTNRKENNEKIESKSIYKDENNKTLLASFTNKNENAILNVSIYMVYYDKSNKIVDIDVKKLDAVAARTTFYCTFEDRSSYYKKYEAYAICEEFGKATSVGDKIEYEVEDSSKKESILSIKNNSEEEIEYVQFTIKYYDEKNKMTIVNYVEESNFTAGESRNIKLEHELSDGTEINYEKYEVELISAFNVNK